MHSSPYIAVILTVAVGFLELFGINPANGQTSNAAVAVAEAAQNRSYAGASLEFWHERIKNVDPKSSSAAAMVEPLLEIIQDTSLPGVDREPFAAYLARVGRPARRVVPLLAQVIDARHENSKPDHRWAARALALMGEAASDATPELVDLLFDHRLPLSDRQSAVEALALIGAAHPDAIPAILRLLQSRPSAEVSAADAAQMRYLAAECIYIASPECGELAAPLLIRLIRDPRESETVRRSAIVAIGALKARGAIATHVLFEELVLGIAPALRDAAAKSLVSVGSAAAPAIRQCLRHSDPEVRWRVAFHLRTLDASQDIFARDLRMSLDDANSLVCICAAESLQILYGRSDGLAHTAIALLQEDDRTVRVRAKQLIIALQPLQDQQRRELQQLLDSDKKYVVQIARATLAQLAAPE